MPGTVGCLLCAGPQPIHFMGIVLLLAAEAPRSAIHRQRRWFLERFPCLLALRRGPCRHRKLSSAVLGPCSCGWWGKGSLSASFCSTVAGEDLAESGGRCMRVLTLPLVQVTLVMAYLNGNDIPNFFKFETLVAKVRLRRSMSADLLHALAATTCLSANSLFPFPDVGAGHWNNMHYIIRPSCE